MGPNARLACQQQRYVETPPPRRRIAHNPHLTQLLLRTWRNQREGRPLGRATTPLARSQLHALSTDSPPPASVPTCGSFCFTARRRTAPRCLDGSILGTIELVGVEAKEKSMMHTLLDSRHVPSRER